MANKRIAWKPEPSINNCRERLLEGYQGQIEYHLFKDNSWIAQLYYNEEEKKRFISELKSKGYSIDKICDFKQEINRITNNIKVHLN